MRNPGNSATAAGRLEIWRRSSSVGGLICIVNVATLNCQAPPALNITVIRPAGRPDCKSDSTPPLHIELLSTAGGIWPRTQFSSITLPNGHARQVNNMPRVQHFSAAPLRQLSKVTICLYFVSADYIRYAIATELNSSLDLVVLA